MKGMPITGLDPAPLIEKVFPKAEWDGDCLVVRPRGFRLFGGYEEKTAYPKVNTLIEGRGMRTVLASRFVYASVHGWDKIDGLMVRHTCDNPPCINLDHLVPGTGSDNMADARSRGRHN